MPLTPRLVRGFKIAYPVSIEAEYRKQLSILATKTQFLTLKHLKDFDFGSSLNLSVRLDDIVDDFENIVRTINSAISLEIVKIIATLSARFNSVKKFVDRSFKQSIAHIANRTLGAHVVALNTNALPAVDIKLLKKIWIEKNTQLIKDIPANTLLKINDAIYDAVSKGESLNSLSNKLNEIFQFSKKRAKTIARDQVAKLKSQISRHNDLAHGFTMYEWSSCKDGAVRASHQVLEGKVCSWLDPTIYKNKADEKWKKRSSIGGVQKHVGEDIMCRCTNIVLLETEVNYDQ
jgi:SPP1 gp7 family putative phage head morphogenesis protein